MLTHHEFAKLLLIRQSPDQVAAGHPDIDALLAQSLVELRCRPFGEPVAELTGRGMAMLRTLGAPQGHDVPA